MAYRKNSVAVVGVGNTLFGRLPGNDPYDLGIIALIFEDACGRPMPARKHILPERNIWRYATRDIKYFLTAPTYRRVRSFTIASARQSRIRSFFCF